MENVFVLFSVLCSLIRHFPLSRQTAARVFHNKLKVWHSFCIQQKKSSQVKYLWLIKLMHTPGTRTPGLSCDLLFQFTLSLGLIFYPQFDIIKIFFHKLFLSYKKKKEIHH